MLAQKPKFYINLGKTKLSKIIGIEHMKGVKRFLHHG
jgi:hypothetical protein